MTGVLLSSILKKLFKKEERLGTSFNHHISLKDDQYFLFRSFEKTYNYVFVSRLRFTHG